MNVRVELAYTLLRAAFKSRNQSYLHLFAKSSFLLFFFSLSFLFFLLELDWVSFLFLVTKSLRRVYSFGYEGLSSVGCLALQKSEIPGDHKEHSWLACFHVCLLESHQRRHWCKETDCKETVLSPLTAIFQWTGKMAPVCRWFVAGELENIAAACPKNSDESLLTISSQERIGLNHSNT